MFSLMLQALTPSGASGGKTVANSVFNVKF
jgi:hypothetical protein